MSKEKVFSIVFILLLMVIQDCAKGAKISEKKTNEQHCKGNWLMGRDEKKKDEEIVDNPKERIKNQQRTWNIQKDEIRRGER